MPIDKQHIKGNVANIVFSAEISPGTTEGLIAAVTQCVTQGATGIYLRFSTQGGSVLHGVHIYNVLRGLPIPLTTHNTGSVNSIGNAIFLAGETRYAVPDSTFMFHGVGFDIANARFEDAEWTPDVSKVADHFPRSAAASRSNRSASACRSSKGSFGRRLSARRFLLHAGSCLLPT